MAFETLFLVPDQSCLLQNAVIEGQLISITGAVHIDLWKNHRDDPTVQLDQIVTPLQKLLISAYDPGRDEKLGVVRGMGDESQCAP